jgi:hypothetical protein
VIFGSRFELVNPTTLATQEHFLSAWPFSVCAGLTMDVSFKVPVILSNWKKERRKEGRKEGNNEVNIIINPITYSFKYNQ